MRLMVDPPTKFRVDISDERLFQDERPVPLTNKAFQLLGFFVRNPGRLLTKDSILDAVWGEVHVSEGLVKDYVRDLRLALDDDPKKPRFIETVHGRGYRFLGGIEIAGEAETQTASGGRPLRPVVAVAPFTNHAGEKRWKRFCDGLGDDLVIDLARYPDLTVLDMSGAASRDRADLVDTGRQLGAGFVLHGSVQASDSDVRVNVRLIDVADGDHIWTEQFDSEVGEFFAIQRDIVAQVASAVGGLTGRIARAERERLGRKSPADLDTYELYRLGIELELPYEREKTLRGFELIQRAVERDPDFARGWLVLGWLCWQIVLEHWAGDLSAYRELEREAFTKAASLDPLDPFALLELGTVRRSNGDVVGCRDALERAVDLGRNQADLSITASTYFATLVGDSDRATELLEMGRGTIFRMSPFQHLSAARVHYFGENFTASVDNARCSPDCMTTRLFELLSLAHSGAREEVEIARRNFAERFPFFDPTQFSEDHPVAAPDAKQRFLDGTAILDPSASARLRIVT